MTWATVAWSWLCYCVGYGLGCYLTQQRAHAELDRLQAELDDLDRTTTDLITRLEQAEQAAGIST